MAMSVAPSAIRRFWPRTPSTVRDAYALSQYEQLAAKIPLLYAALILIVIAATANASPGAPLAIRHGIPLIVISTIVVRSVVWLRRPRRGIAASAARQYIRRAAMVSSCIAALSSIWCYFSWVHAPATIALYFPLFMAMGSLATIVCVSMIRTAAMLNIFLGLLPMTIALMTAGNPMALAAGISIAVTAVFLGILVIKQHENTVALLQLQAQMRELAETDPLTGLINRRALHDRLRILIGSGDSPVTSGVPGTGNGTTLMLLDLDGFKPVNDRHGHCAGDEVLREVATRLIETIGDDGFACRIGGDEFALIVLPAAARSAHVIGTAVLAALARPYPVEGHVLHVGASLGMAAWPADGRTTDELYRCADRALYAAKALQAPDAETGSAIVPDVAA